MSLLSILIFISHLSQASNGEEEPVHLVGERFPVPGEEDRHLLSVDFPVHLSHVQHLVLELLPLTGSKQSKETRGELNQIKFLGKDSKSKPIGTIKHSNKHMMYISIKLHGQSNPLLVSRPNKVPGSRFGACDPSWMKLQVSPRPKTFRTTSIETRDLDFSF